MEPEHDDEPLVEVVVSKAVKGNGHELVKTLRNSRFQLVRRHWRDGSHPLTQRVALTVRAGPAHIHGGCAWSMEPATTASGRTLAWKQCTGAEELIMATPQGWHHHIALTRIRVHNCAVVVGESSTRDPPGHVQRQSHSCRYVHQLKRRHPWVPQLSLYRQVHTLDHTVKAAGLLKCGAGGARGMQGALVGFLIGASSAYVTMSMRVEKVKVRRQLRAASHTRSQATGEARCV
jgi:hypothetical protein